MDYIEATILDYLKANGKASRKELYYLTGLADVKIRQVIGGLRDKGEPIGLDYRKGYVYNDPVGTKRIEQAYKARIRTEVRRLAAIQNRPLDGQLTLEEVLDGVLL